MGKEDAALGKAVPELTAKLEDDKGDHKESAPLQMAAQQSALDTTPAPVQPTVLPAKTEPGKAHKPPLPQLTQSAEGKVAQPQIEQGLRGIRTQDGDIPVTPSPKPSLLAKGASDPKQADQKQQLAATEVKSKADAALAALHKGPGPEKVQPIQLEEKHKIELAHKPQAYETVALEGHKKYLSLGQ